MPAPYGLTATGFSRKTLQEVLDEIESEEKARIDSRLNTQPEEPIGQLNGIFASKLSELWELAEAVNAGRFPDGASGFQLDEVASITGTLRGPATKGTVTLDLTASAPTTVPAGAIAQVLGDDANRWVTLEDVVFAAPGTLSVEAEAEVAGVFIANPTTITVIVTPVAGWTDVTNPASATPGTDIDTDAQLRIRRENELARAGSATVDAIRTDVLDVEDVTSVTIFHNPTNFVDGDGLPPGTVEALVIGGIDQDVRDALLATVAAGVDTFGTTVGTAADSQGKLHTVRFTRPVEIDILVEIDLTIDAQEYPAGGDALVQAAVESYINSLPVGFDVFQSQVSGAGIDAADGILNVTAVRIGSVSPAVAPVASDYTITARQLATMSAAANVTVATTPGSP
jgi:uncharacterized phage protein gp47/JayE